MSEEDARTDELRALSNRLGLGIGDLTLLDRALTHASLSSESVSPVPDYESLEFLGDAALGLAVAHYLFEACPDRTPGEYSRMRAGLVNRRMLADVAGALDIASAIRLGKGEERAGGRWRSSLLADCLESVIGVVYLDKGWDAARAFIERILGEALETAARDGVVWDYKSRLQHYCQASRIELPRFVVVRSEGPDHEKEFEVEAIVQGRPAGRGNGRSKKDAEQAAARAALEHEGQLD